MVITLITVDNKSFYIRKNYHKYIIIPCVYFLFEEWNNALKFSMIFNTKMK